MARQSKSTPTNVSVPQVSGTTEVLPDPEGLVNAISRIGYSTSEALADLIDNSIDAKAQKVAIRVLRSGGELTSMAVADDGDGIEPRRIDAAMGFGVRSKKGDRTLGKYGM